MKFGSPSAPESTPSSPFLSEKKKDSDSGSEKKKKPAASAAMLAELATEKTIRNEARPPQPHSVWDKIKAEANKPRLAEVPLFGIRKPEIETRAGAENPVGTKNAVNVAPIPVRRDGETVFTRPEAAAAEIDATKTTTTEVTAEKEPEEVKQAVRSFVERRMQDADAKLQELPKDKLDTPEAAEAAAGAALPRAMLERLASDPDESFEGSLAAAGEEVAERVAGAPAAEPALEMPDISRRPTPAVDHEALDYDTTLETEAQSAAPGELNNETPEPTGESTEFTVPPHELYGLAGPGGPHGPEGPGSPPFPPPGGAGGPEGMPFGAGSASAATGGAYEAAGVAAARGIPAAEAYANERTALGQGLLAGGIAGYFFGRHRGRKQGRRTAEKQFAPVRRNLERKVHYLQEAITAKEQQVKALARDKMGMVLQRDERRRVVDRLLQPAARPTMKPEAARAGAKSRPEAPAAAETIGRRAADGMTSEHIVRAAEAPAGELYSRQFAGNRPQTAELLINHRYEQAFSEAPAGAAELSPVIPFTKKAEEFSREELLATAEKVKVEGTSLKEMAELGRLDEPGLRRVVGEFLRGGDVSKAVSQEIKERELKFERDPRMRHSAAGRKDSGPGGGAGAGGGGAADNGLLGILARSNPAARDNPAGQGAASDSGPAGTGQGPVPDESTLRAIRKQQIATIGGTAALVALSVLILLWLVG